jgi:uroporphyrinogen III methyltransferase / synthase
MDLQGVRILVTRPAGQADAMMQQIRDRGGIAILMPMIRILPPASWDECDAQIGRLRDFAGIVFSSTNAVEFFLDRCAEKGAGRAMPPGMLTYAVGAKTAEALRESGLAPAFIPAEFKGAELAAHFRSQDLRGRLFLLPRGDQGRGEVEAGLQQAGAMAVPVVVYRTVGPEDASASAVRAALAGRSIDVVTFTSSSAVDHFMQVLNEELRLVARTSLIVGVIGGTTADAARHLGLPVQVIAETSTGEGLIESLAAWNSTVQP